jgi:hypothetical protein
VISLSNSNSIAGLPASLLGGGTPPAGLDFVSTWDTTQGGKSASDTVVLPSIELVVRTQAQLIGEMVILMSSKLCE